MHDKVSGLCLSRLNAVVCDESGGALICQPQSAPELAAEWPSTHVASSRHVNTPEHPVHCLQIKQQHQDLAFRLIKVQRHVDALLGHVAVELGQKDPREGAVVEQLGAMLAQAESILGPGEAGVSVTWQQPLGKAGGHTAALHVILREWITKWACQVRLSAPSGEADSW